MRLHEQFKRRIAARWVKDRTYGIFVFGAITDCRGRALLLDLFVSLVSLNTRETWFTRPIVVGLVFSVFCSSRSLSSQSQQIMEIPN